MENQELCAACGKLGVSCVVECAGNCKQPSPLCDACHEEFGNSFTCEMCIEEKADMLEEQDLEGDAPEHATRFQNRAEPPDRS